MHNHVPENPASHAATAAVVICLLASVYFGALVWY